jgi:hypothetical protein
MPVRMGCPEGYAWYSDMASAFIYAADNGADVINCSFGGSYSLTIKNAVNYATGNGVVFVASAGNGNKTPIDYPALFPNVVAVGASDHSDPDGRASFSNWGTGVSTNKLVEAVAPGVDNVSTGVYSVYDQNQGWGPAGGASYFIASGTSFSAPLVSAAIALHLCQCPDDGYNEVWTALPGCTYDLPDDPDDSPDAGANWDGWGMIDYSCMVGSCLAAPEFEVTCPSDTFGDHWWDIDFTFEITNVGTAPANGISYSILESPHPCWGAACGHFWVADTLDPGESYTVNYLVHIPDTAAVGMYRDILFKAGPGAPLGAGSDSCVTRVISTGPTAIAISSMETDCSGGGIALAWRYSGEPVAGFSLYRTPLGSQNRVKVNENLITSQTGKYRFVDTGAENGVKYNYQLFGVDKLSGTEEFVADFGGPLQISPFRLALRQNVPNPFARGTSISFDIPGRAPVSIAVYDVSGRKVATLQDSVLDPGIYSIEWSAKDAHGRGLPAGIYFCRLTSNGKSVVRKMVVAR